MDSPSSALEQNIDLSKLSEKDKQELQQFIVNESQKARIQQCWFFPRALSNFLNVSFHCSCKFHIALLFGICGSLQKLGKLMFVLPSCPLPHGYLLEEMCDGYDSEREARQE
jgi:hypothetical protein